MQYLATIARLALGGLLVLLAPCSAPADQAANLLLNGPAPTDGERSLGAWYPVSQRDPRVKFWLDIDRARAGKGCLAIAREQAGERPASNNWAQKLGSVPVGKTLRLSGYIRTEEADAANICVQCWGPEEKRLIGFASTPMFRGTHAWTLAQAPDVIVPPTTVSVVVRAALTGKGRAYFDDLLLQVVDEPVHPSPGLDTYVKGRIVRTLPVVKDCMVLAYLPEWSHGDLDNIAVADNDGGVRTLLAWQGPTPDEAAEANLRFVLAVFAREVRRHGEPSPIQIHEILEDWDELASWKVQPRFAPKPVARFPVTAGEGWKLFDVTPIVRSQLKTQRPGHGVVLRFANENRSEANKDWSGYGLVGREGLGRWENCRPVLLVIDPRGLGRASESSRE